MSKSKKNTIDPQQIIENFGADAVRLFILSDSPPEKDVQWSERGMESAYKFLQKLWLLHQKILNKNLLLGDALSLKISKKNKKPIVFSEWAFVDTMKLKRRDFTFKHLIDARPFDGFNLFSDLGDEAIIPEPYKEYDSIYFLKVYELN